MIAKPSVYMTIFIQPPFPHSSEVKFASIYVWRFVIIFLLVPPPIFSSWKTINSLVLILRNMKFRNFSNNRSKKQVTWSFQNENITDNSTNPLRFPLNPKVTLNLGLARSRTKQSTYVTIFHHFFQNTPPTLRQDEFSCSERIKS